MLVRRLDAGRCRCRGRCWRRSRGNGCRLGSSGGGVGDRRAADGAVGEQLVEHEPRRAGHEAGQAAAHQRRMQQAADVGTGRAALGGGDQPRTTQQLPQRQRHALKISTLGAVLHEPPRKSQQRLHDGAQLCVSDVGDVGAGDGDDVGLGQRRHRVGVEHGHQLGRQPAVLGSRRRTDRHQPERRVHPPHHSPVRRSLWVVVRDEQRTVEQRQLAVVDEPLQDGQRVERQPIDVVEHRQFAVDSRRDQRRRLPDRVAAGVGRAALQQVAGAEVLVERQRLDLVAEQLRKSPDDGRFARAVRSNQQQIAAPGVVLQHLQQQQPFDTGLDERSVHRCRTRASGHVAQRHCLVGLGAESDVDEAVRGPKEVERRVGRLRCGRVEQLEPLDALLPAVDVAAAVQRVYPAAALTPSDDDKSALVAVQQAAKRFKLLDAATPQPTYSAFNLLRTSHCFVDVTFSTESDQAVTLRNVPAGPRAATVNRAFVETGVERLLLLQMLQDHARGRDLLLIGPHGSGKSTVIRRFAELLGYEIETLTLYKDLSTRDLLQRRTTDAGGNSIWQASPLVSAAVDGKLAVLDNVDRLPLDALAVLQRLVHDRQLTLFDGSLLVSHDDPQAASDGRVVRRVHPSFRLVAVGAPPTAEHRWLTPELVPMFHAHSMPPLSEPDVIAIARANIADVTDAELSAVVQPLLAFSRRLVQHSAQRTDLQGVSLSLRQLLRCARLVTAAQRRSPGADVSRLLHAALMRSCLARFMPSSARLVLDKLLADCAIRGPPVAHPASAAAKPTPVASAAAPAPAAAATTSSVQSAHQHLVPKTLFYDVPSQLEILHDMQLDYETGEHMLLIGSQGTGKNKLTDRFLQSRNLPRQYIQLHRDTTVQSLTVQATIADGRIESLPSPLLLAVQHGHVLVIDEADKAPLEVVTVLRGLIDGDMSLPDGRRIVAPRLLPPAEPVASHVIPMHPDFRMIVLANKPGYPFLGNDFFAECGDLFSAHAVDNPDYASELRMLSWYGPDVDPETLQRLCSAFAELRALVDEGRLSYPYSTREAVAIVRHLQAFPADSLAQALDNVFSFDVYQDATVQQLLEVFVKHGVDVDPNRFLLRQPSSLSSEQRLSVVYEEQESKNKFDPTQPKHGQDDPDNNPHVGGNTWAGGVGGSDTAGLGGVGGPYRLDAGHPVFQVSQQVKDSISKEALAAARAMGQAALRQRLQEIGMSSADSSQYDRLLGSVRVELQQLRVMLEALQSKSRERVWLRNQTAGDFDESKVVESLTGEKGVFKRRGESQDEDPSQRKKKIVQFVMDVSGSMYRFNSFDGRLTRLLSTTVMIMEAFQGVESRIDYSIVGHSGDSARIPFVHFSKPPLNRKERFAVIEKMAAHAQYCWSGDMTVEATQHAVDTLSRQHEADERFVILVSDANLARYGIRPETLGQAMTSSKNVKAFAVFIGSLADQADRLIRGLPVGRGFVCTDTNTLPTTFKQILTADVVT
eukprot:TRINITY_DN10050_c0_g5_i1.p1 TRINITY_DN10050_c0_g5~~TRINITY_DN10050_c0_g5_i1.p1  ORF type:complete len:1481 (+),score=541.02 TRINITY_DN10050_c0_g5_i1:2061-6503(+)